MMLSNIRRCAVMVGLALGLVTCPALAQQVILLRPAGADPLLSEAFNRLRAELALQHFEVEVIAVEVGAQPCGALEEVAAREQAFAGIALTRRVDMAQADVCIADRVTGKLVQRTLSLPNTADAPSVLAVRAVDLLRASLRELEPDERPPADVVGVDPRRAPSSVGDWSRPAPSRWRIEVGGMVFGVSADVGPAFGPSLKPSFRPRLGGSDRVTLGLQLALPLVGGSFHADTGSATLWQSVSALELGYDVLRHERLELGLLIGAGFHHLEAQGQADPPLESRTAGVTSALFALGASAALSLTARTALAAGFRLSSWTPRPAVAIGLPRYDFPWVVGSVSLGLVIGI